VLSRAIVIIGVVGGAAAFAAPAPPPRAKPVLYHPIKQGDEWVYTDGKEDETQVITAVEENKGRQLVSVGRKVKDKVIPLWTVAVSEEGVYQTADDDTKFESPLCRVKLPAKSGDKWIIDFNQPGYAVMDGFGSVAVDEEIEVPAGKFVTIKIEWKYKSDIHDRHFIIWHAPGLGMVKQENCIADRTIVMKSFTPGKK
jgi:hypothetical protein